MKKKHTILIALVLAILAAIFGVPEEEAPVISTQEIVAAQVMDEGSSLIQPDGIYTSKKDVALYIERIDEMIERKEKMLEKLDGVY